MDSWLKLHIPLLFLAYLLLALASAIGIVFLIQERLMKWRRPEALSLRLPSLEAMDEFIYKMIFMAFPLLLVGIVLGGLWARQAWGRFWGWDPKETFSLVTATIYFIYLMLRWFKGWRGRKSTYLSLVGFVLVVFTWLAVNGLSPLHKF